MDNTLLASDDLTNLCTVRDYIRFSYSLFNQHDVFFGHGVDNAYDEATALVLQTIALPPDATELWLDARLTLKERIQIVQRLGERIFNRTPLPYLTGKAYYAGLEFKVTPDVLIPRSPVAELIESRFEPWYQINEDTRVLDLCTGSGCIALAIKYWLNPSEVVGTDISEAALDIARENADKLGLDVQFILSDLFNGLKGQKFDLIVSNPPYVGDEEYDNLPAEYQKEPRLALTSKAGGAYIPLKILSQAAEHLTDGGVLVLEVGHSDALLDQILEDIPLVWIEFEYGGQGVFTIEKDVLISYAEPIKRALANTENL